MPFGFLALTLSISDLILDVSESRSRRLHPAFCADDLALHADHVRGGRHQEDVRIGLADEGPGRAGSDRHAELNEEIKLLAARSEFQMQPKFSYGPAALKSSVLLNTRVRSSLRKKIYISLIHI